MRTLTEKATEIANKARNPRLAPFAYMLLSKNYDEEIITVFFDFWENFLPADEWKDEYTAVYDGEQVFKLCNIVDHMTEFCGNEELLGVVEIMQSRLDRIRRWIK